MSLGQDWIRLMMGLIAEWIGPFPGKASLNLSNFATSQAPPSTLN
jgi:hypothetical protein